MNLSKTRNSTDELHAENAPRICIQHGWYFGSKMGGGRILWKSLEILPQEKFPILHLKRRGKGLRVKDGRGGRGANVVLVWLIIDIAGIHQRS